jgi:hypothetical protein
VVRSRFLPKDSSANGPTNLPVMTAESGRAIIRYSSPTPWGVAIVLSVGLWTILLLSIWRLVT